MHHAYNIVAGLPPCTNEFTDEGLPSVAKEAVQVLRSMYQVRPKKKIGVFTVCRPTLFYSCRPYHFFSKNKKKTRLLSDPARAVPDFSTSILNFSLILFYLVCSQTFYGYLRILSIQDGDVLVAFRFKKCDHQDQKSLFEATSQMT